MGTPVEITIRANGANQVVAEFERVKASLSSFTSGLSGLSSTFATVAGALGIGGFALATVAAVRAGMEYNTTLEQQTAAFKTLLGSVDAAERRMEDLADFAASTPFELPEVVAASRLLQTLTDGALAGGDALRLVGDAAAASGRSFEEAAMWIGRLYAGLKSGTPVGEATMRLLEMGLVSGDTKRSLDDLAKSGDATGRAMEIVEQTFSRTSGAMAEQAKTMAGLNSTLSDTIKSVAADAVLPAWEKLKEVLRSVLESLGAIPAAAEAARSASVQMQQSILALGKAGTESERVANVEKLRAKQDEYNRALDMTTARLGEVNKQISDNAEKSLFQVGRANIELATERDELMEREVALRRELNATEAVIKRLESAAAKATAAAGTAGIETQKAVRVSASQNLGMASPDEEEASIEKARFKLYQQQERDAMRPQKSQDMGADQGEAPEDAYWRTQAADEYARQNQELEYQAELEEEINDRMRDRNDLSFQIRQNVESLQTPAEGFANMLVGTVRSAMDSVAYSLSGLIQGTMTWQQALRNVGNTILTTVLQAIIRMFTEWVLRRIFASQIEVQSNTTEAASKAPNALMESITSYGLAAIIGVAAFVAAMALSGGFAEGGRPPVGRPALVGEEGPELFIPDRAGTVIPNDITNALATLAPTDVGFGQTTGGESSPTRIIIVDDRNSVDSLRRDPRFRNLVLDMMEERA